MSNSTTPLYTTKAHVFQINPETRTSWLPKNELAVSVSFVVYLTNQGERQLRLIGTDEDEQILDAVILPNTIFTKRSQKFGQWTDQTGMVYGLGFDSELELDAFTDALHRLQRDILSPDGSNSIRRPEVDYQNRNISNNSRSQSMSGIQNKIHNNNSTNNNSNNFDTKSYQRPYNNKNLDLSENNGSELNNRNTSNDTISESAIIEQLRYENERLKQVIEENSKNSVIWNNELMNLRTNNAKLTQALQESKANVKEWMMELESLRDENHQLKTRINEIEMSPSAVMRTKENQMDDLQKSLEKLEVQARKFDSLNAQLEAKIANLSLISKDGH